MQTLPEGYTKGVSENAAKKAIGNGWTVDVISTFFEKLNEELKNDYDDLYDYDNML